MVSSHEYFKQFIQGWFTQNSIRSRSNRTRIACITLCCLDALPRLWDRLQRAFTCFAQCVNVVLIGGGAASCTVRTCNSCPYCRNWFDSLVPRTDFNAWTVVIKFASIPVYSSATFGSINAYERNNSCGETNLETFHDVPARPLSLALRPVLCCVADRSRPRPWVFDDMMLIDNRSICIQIFGWLDPPIWPF
jgi:hypothetical protein